MEMTATYFFDHMLPALLARDVAHSSLEASVSFYVLGEDGGRWMLQLGSAPSLSVQGPGVLGDLHMTMTESVFSEFAAGTLDPVSAVRAGNMEFIGDLDLLGELAAMWRRSLSLRDLAHEAGVSI